MRNGESRGRAYLFDNYQLSSHPRDTSSARMPTVRFAPLGLEGSSFEDETILDVARRASAPIGNSCGGVGWCARCRVRVVVGAENLSEVTSVERVKGSELAFAHDERLACQAAVKGDVTVTTTYWGPLR